MSIATSAGLELITRYGAPERWLAVLVTLRPDGEPSTSVVNAGIVAHPVTGREVPPTEASSSYVHISCRASRHCMLLLACTLAPPFVRYKCTTSCAHRNHVNCGYLARV